MKKQRKQWMNVGLGLAGLILFCWALALLGCLGRFAIGRVALTCGLLAAPWLAWRFWRFVQRTLTPDGEDDVWD